MQDYKVVFSGQDNLSPQVKKIKGEFDGLSNATEKIDKIQQKFDKISNSTAPLKRQLKDLQGIMAKMNLDGLGNTEMYSKIAERAGEIKDAIADAADATSKFASDTFKLDAAIQGLQGIAGAAAVATGAMSLLGKENEDVARAIQKVQAVLAILNGVQSVANLLQKDSALMQRVKQIQLAATTAATNKATVAEGANTVATAANTSATKAWNMVKAISKALLGDWTGLLLVGAAALGTYAIATSNSTEELENQNKSLRKGESALRKETYSALIDKYTSLKTEWISLSTAHEKNEWIKNNQTNFNELGVSVNNVTDAEKVFNGNTDAIVQAFKARAQAAAEAANLTELYKKRLQLQDAYDAAVAGAKALGMVNTPIIEAALAQLDIVDKKIGEGEQRVKNLAKNLPKVSNGGGGKTPKATSSKPTKTTKVEDPKEKIIKKATDKFETSLRKNALEDEGIKVPYEFVPKKTPEQVKEEILGDTSTWTDELQGNIDKLFGEARSVQMRFDAGELNIDDAQAILDQISNMLHLDIPIQLDTSKVDKNSKELNQAADAVGQFGSSLSSMGKELDMPEFDIMGTIAQAVANVALGYSKANAQAGSGAAGGPWGWVAFAAIGLAEMLAVIASIKSATAGFANGGIVGGSSYSGDKLLARVNSGEMILPAKKASELGNMLQENSNTETYSSVEWKIKGSDLYGTLHNFSKVKAKSGKITGIK